MVLPTGRADSAASSDQRRQRDRGECERRRSLARVVQRAPHQVGRPIDRLRQGLAGTLHAGSALSCSRSAVSSAGVRMPRRSWLTLATTVPRAASLALRQSAARSSCCIAASSRPATAISSFGSTRDIVRIERRRALRVGAERGDAAGDPAHRADQQKRTPPDRPVRRSRRRSAAARTGKIAGELPQRPAERTFMQPHLELVVGRERAVRRSPGSAGSPRSDDGIAAPAGCGRAGPPAAGRSVPSGISAVLPTVDRRRRPGRSARIASVPDSRSSSSRFAGIHRAAARPRARRSTASSMRPISQLRRSCAI